MSITSGCRPFTEDSNVASSPAFLIVLSISLLDFSAIDSILAGWILPSFINSFKAFIATCLLIGSKQETVTDSGASSTIRSTPVAFSIALIFLPSLPISLPFISSLGIETACIVSSATTSDAYLCTAPAITFFAWSSTLASSSCSAALNFFAMLCSMSSCASFKRISFASW